MGWETNSWNGFRALFPSANSRQNTEVLKLKQVKHGVPRNTILQLLTKYCQTFYVIVPFPFTTSEAEHTSYHRKLNVHAFSWVAAWINVWNINSFHATGHFLYLQGDQETSRGINGLRNYQICENLKKQPPRCSVKKGVPNNFANFTGKHLCWILFLIKLQAQYLQLYQKKTSAQVFSCEICEIFKKTYFEEHLRTAASQPLTCM